MVGEVKDNQHSIVQIVRSRSCCTTLCLCHLRSYQAITLCCITQSKIISRHHIHIVSNQIMSHDTAYYPIVSYHIRSRDLIQYNVASSHIMSHSCTSCCTIVHHLALPHTILSGITCCHPVSKHWFHVASRYSISQHITYHLSLIWHQMKTYHVISSIYHKSKF